MANNPYVNKVVLGNQTVMDISDTDAEEADVVEGKTFYKKTGARATGTASYYSPNDTAETAINDTDYFPFYDTSATAKRKTLWSNIKTKLKAYFDGIYSTFSGSYNDLEDKPTIPSVGNGTLTIQKNGTNVATFTANQSGNATANISVPTTYAGSDSAGGKANSAARADIATAAYAVKDSSSAADTTFSYYKAAMGYANYTYLAGWNGYELRRVEKSQFSPASSVSTRTQTVTITVNAGSWGLATITESSLTGNTVFMSIFADVNNASIVPINIVGRGTGSSKQFYVRNITSSAATATITIITIYFRN